MKIEIENYKCPSWNDMQVAHWAMRAADREVLKLLAYGAANNARKKTKVKVPVVVKIEAHFKDGKRRDPDNLYVKPILDGLVKAGVFADDNGEVIKSITLIAKVKMKSNGIIISINE